MLHFTRERSEMFYEKNISNNNFIFMYSIDASECQRN